MSEWGNPAEVMFSHTVLSQAGTDKVTRGTETSKYPQEEKATAIFLVAASERERGQTTSLLGGLRTVISDEVMLSE